MEAFRFELKNPLECWIDAKDLDQAIAIFESFTDGEGIPWEPSNLQPTVAIYDENGEFLERIQ
jgi:hypothetical protein